MRKIIGLGICLVAAGCTATPSRYAASLPENDPKWNSKECKDIRLKALDYNDKTGGRMAIGLASGLLLGPFGLPIAAAADAKQEEIRQDWAREVHMACSSRPLPKSLQPKPKAVAK